MQIAARKLKAVANPGEWTPAESAELYGIRNWGAGYFDIAVRDVVMSIAAFTLARLTEARQESLVHGGSTVAQHRRHVTA